MYTGGLLWCFFALHVLCEHYFIHAIIAVCTKLQLREEVAGATFMAVSSSLPEVLANVIDLFGESNSLGASTIVGSTVFNVLVGIGYAMIRTAEINKELTLDWPPVIRDLIFWVIGSFGVIGVFYDGRCDVHESVIFVVIYIIYVIVVKYFPQIRGLFKACAEPQSVRESTFYLETSKRASMVEMMIPNVVIPKNADDIVAVVENGEGGADAADAETASPAADKPAATTTTSDVTKKPETKKKPEAPSEDTEKKAGKNWFFPFICMIIYKGVSLPLKILFMVIPDCSETGKPQLWWATFTLCVIIMGAIVFAIIELANAAGCVLDIAPVLMGSTVLAVGTSMPDCLSSAAAAKTGLIGMACSNAIGSNVFDIFFALGFPWLLVHIAYAAEPIAVNNDNLVGPVVWMIGAAAVIAGVFMYTKWKFSQNGGYFLVVCYLAYLIYTIVTNVI